MMSTVDLRHALQLYHRLVWVLCLGLTSFAVVPAATGQDAQVQPADFPGPFEATSRYRALADAAVEAEAEVAALSQVDDLAAEIEENREGLDDLRTVMLTVADAEYVRVERLGRVRDQSAQFEQRLEGLRQRAMDRLESLDELQAAWAQRRSFWQSWRAALEGDPRLPAVESDFRRAIERIDAVLAQVDDAIPAVVEVQQDAAALRVEAEEIGERVAAIRAGRREAMLQRGQPVLFSPAHLTALAEEVRAWLPVAALRVGDYSGFIQANLLRLLFHIVLILGLSVLARRLSRLSIPEGAWSGLLLRPRALAVFSATSLLMPRYTLTPALWDVLMWALLASSGAVLATRLVRVPTLRMMVYYFAGLYPAILLLEALATPASVFRLALGGIAALGLVLFAGLLRREFRRPDASPWVRWSLGIGLFMWFVVLIAEIAGFYLLARWILHATVRSAYVIFVVALLVMLARGGVRTLVRLEAKGRLSFLQTVGIPLMERLLRLMQVALVVVAVLYVLDIWEAVASPGLAWAAFTAAGFTVAGIEITIGRIITAGLLVYLAVLVSWLLRTFARSEMYPRWELERGVGDSINSLVHYFLITLGVLIGLSALGVELQNFAIVAGALGVGIGFGLQNIVNNFVSGLILLFERPVRVGDTVVMGSELGTIQKIGLRSTTVLTFDQAEVIVPNADLVSEKVTNWTLTDPVARLILPVGVAYGTNVQKVIEILNDAAKAHPDVLPHPSPQPLFMAFGDSALDFELRVWVQELRLRLPVRSAILADIDRRFREAGIEIPFPQRDLHLRSVDGEIIARMGRGDTGGGDDVDVPQLP